MPAILRATTHQNSADPRCAFPLRPPKQIPHDDPESPADTRQEKSYPQLAESIVKHGSGILDRLINGPPKQQMEGIPMPVDDEDPPDADGLDDDAGGEPPQTTPPPDPSADQGDVAAAIIEDSNKARSEVLASADTNGEVDHNAPSASPRVAWLNAGAEPEANAYNYEGDPGYTDPDSPSRPNMGTGWQKGGRNYWRVNVGGENEDTRMVNGSPVQQLGALGGGYAPGSSAGLGPAVDERDDNGATGGEEFTIDTKQDDEFHGSPSSWLPVQTATQQTGATAADTGNGLSDEAYLADLGKKGPSTRPVPGAALTIDESADNAAAGDDFSFSTAKADSFDCGDDCAISPTATVIGDPDAPQEADLSVPHDAEVGPGGSEAATPPAEAPAVEAEGVEAVEAPVVKAAPPQTLALKPTSGPMGIAQGDIIRPRPGPAGMSGDSGPAPI